MKLFRIYEILIPVLVFPLACWLWLHRYNGELRLALPAILSPVICSYAMAFIGIDRLKLWSIKSSFGPNGIRLQHGFLLGTMSGLFALYVLPFPGSKLTLYSVFQSAFILGSVLAFWNWIYDMIAIKKGLLVVYNRQYADQRGAEAIATQYAPAFFGLFGFAYGASLRIWEKLLADTSQSALIVVAILLCSFVLMLGLPAVCTIMVSRAYVGESGLRSYHPDLEDNQSSKERAFSDSGSVGPSEASTVKNGTSGNQ